MRAAFVTERAALFASASAPSLVPAVGVRRMDGALWLVSELPEGVWLDRLLSLTWVRPAQAVAIGLDVMYGVRTMHSAGYAHGDLSAGQFRVGVDGTVRMDSWLAGALSGSTELEQRQRADLGAVATLLDDLATAARRALGLANGSTPALVVALETAATVAAEPGARAELVATPLEHACGAEQGRGARSELAALVAAANDLTSGPPPPVRPSPPDAVDAAGVAGTATPASRLLAADIPADRLRAALHTAWRRVWTGLLALVLIGGVVALEFAFLHERLMQDLHLLTGGASAPGGASPGAPARPALQPVPTPAPPRAGAVDQVNLRALNSCAPGTVCAVRVLVRLRAPDQPPPQSP
ncbi:MAG TPA: hypothetical protein VGI84_07295, partial [Pseudonocardiaceae bacterium]